MLKPSSQRGRRMARRRSWRGLSSSWTCDLRWMVRPGYSSVSHEPGLDVGSSGVLLDLPRDWTKDEMSPTMMATTTEMPAIGTAPCAQAQSQVKKN